MNGNALGLIETMGLVGLITCGRCHAQGGDASSSPARSSSSTAGS